MEKVNKKGSLTSRTLEKLGFSTFRFRSNSDSEVNDRRNGGKGSGSDLSKGPGDTSVNTIARSELEYTDELISPFTVDTLESLVKKSPKATKKTLRDRIWGQRLEETVPTAKFYVDDDEDMVTLTKPGESHEETATTTTMQEKKKKVQPEGTNLYTVQDPDTLEKIAAMHDTTPSELKKMNRLVTPVIFPGQTLFVPDEDYVSAQALLSPPPTSKDPPTFNPISPPATSKDNRPQMGVPLITAGNSSPTKVPGHAQRQTPVSSPTATTFDFELVPPPHKLSEDEVQQLDQDCMERFIKLNVKHITDGQGVVRGVLLVTPNAVMFDPDVSDPLVVERGAEKYGMIAPLDLIISAAMYHDIAAMKLRGQKMDDGTAYPKPEVYHDKSCPLSKVRLEQSQKHEQDQMGSALPKDLRNKLGKTLTKTDSVCSCGAGALEMDNQITDEDIDRALGEIDEVVDDVADEFNKGRTDETIPDADSDSKTVDKDEDVFSDQTEDSADVGDLPNVATDSSSSHKGKKLSVSFSVTDSAGVASDEATPAESVTEKEPSVPNAESAAPSDPKAETAAVGTDTDTDTDSKQQDVKPSQEAASETCDAEAYSSDKEKASEDTTTENTVETDKNNKEGDESDDKEKETRIGNIVYLPVTDENGQLSLRSLEETQNTLSKMSESEFGEISKSDTNLASISVREPEKPRSSSTSSLGPFSPTPHLNAFVNYATGFFQKHASENSIQDIKDMILDAAPGQKKMSDLPVFSSAPSSEAGRRKGKMSRHQNTAHEVEVESAISMDEKADLMTMDYDRFKPRLSASFSDPPLYLCLKLGHPQNKQAVFHNYSIESYGRRRKKSEYWFSIPREKVDHLYAFFVQWTPEIYGDAEELTAEKRGFVVIEDGEEDDLDMLDEHFGPNSSFQKDWEIISQHEALKRRSIVFDVPLPLPELIGESAILSEHHISEISQNLPGRTVGYPWSLIYSTDKHGFSLKTVYRAMQGLESPILLVVKDTHDNVFGALTSCELRTSESFYGTGETFLYSFYPEFTVYHWAGDNNFFIKGDQHSLCIGAGQGVNGLWLDEDLYHGRTNKCETFNNDILTEKEDFVVKAFEAWAFVDEL